MTTTVQTFSINVVGNAFTLAAAGDTYYVQQGVTVAANPFSGQFAIGGYFGVTISLDGHVFSSRSGIYVGTAGQDTYINIGATGALQSTNGYTALGVYGTHHIVNHGLIDSSGYIATGMFTVGAGLMQNFGTISGEYSAVENLDSNALDIVTTVNYGTISGTYYAYYAGFGPSIDVVTNLGTMSGTVLLGDAADNLTNGGIISGSVYTGSGNDQIVNYGHIYGNIDLGSENDTLYTDLSALGGPYTIQGGSGTDAVVNTDNDHTVLFNMADNGFEIFYGGAMASYVYGGTATAGLTFVGKGAADAFIGGSGADVVIGGAGGDYLDGGAGGSNTLSYSTSLLGVTVNLGAGTATGGDAAGDYFLNFQNLNGSAAGDVLVGDGGANTLYGDAGNDYMFGSSGADLLIGAAGNDYLSGGAGNDIFYYAAPGYGNDEIVDFTIGQDTMYISTSIAANFAGLTIFQYLADTYVGAGGNYFHLDNTVATNLHASDFVFF